MRMGEQGGTLAVRIARRADAAAPAGALGRVAAGARTQARDAQVSAQVGRPAPSAPRVLAVERQARAARWLAPPRPTEARARGARRGSRVLHRGAPPQPRTPRPSASPPAQPAPPAESEQARQNREAAARLGFSATPTFGSNKNLGGGMFQVRNVNLERAELAFYGWNKFINRISLQVFEVQRGSNPNTQIAVVRKIIEIIREQESGNFIWESLRLRRDITLSARPADNAGLEAFMMEEFFSDGRLR